MCARSSSCSDMMVVVVVEVVEAEVEVEEAVAEEMVVVVVSSDGCALIVLFFDSLLFFFFSLYHVSRHLLRLVLRCEVSLSVSVFFKAQQGQKARSKLGNVAHNRLAKKRRLRASNDLKYLRTRE